MQELFYTIYETTCKVNGKKYRGFHVTSNPNDDYLGSGSFLKKAIRKYGAENFEKHVLEFCESFEAMLIAEAKWVDESWISREDTYNLLEGGKGGWDYINTLGLRWTEEKKIEWSALMKKKKAGCRFPAKAYETPGFLGKKHTEESKRKITENNASRLTQEEVTKRLNDVSTIEKKRGYIGKLANMWGISHTQVRRFLNDNGV